MIMHCGSFYDWVQGEPVPAWQLVQARELLKLNHALVAQEIENCLEGIDLVIDAGMVPVAEADTTCIFYPEVYPNEATALTDIQRLADAGALGVIIGDEVGLNHADVLDWLDLMVPACQAAGIEPILYSNDHGHFQLAVTYGASMWYEFYLNLYQGGGWLIHTDAQFDANLAERIGDMETKERTFLDAMFMQFSGFPNFVEGGEWTWPTPEVERVKRAMAGLKSFGAEDWSDRLVIWSTDDQVNFTTALDMPPQSAAVKNGWTRALVLT